MACEPCCGVLYRVSSWGGLDAESAFKPCIPLHLTTSSFVCVLERGGLGVYPLASLSTMLLKRDTWLPNVSSRREPCFHLCPRLSFFFFFFVRVCVCDCGEEAVCVWLWWKAWGDSIVAPTKGRLHNRPVSERGGWVRDELIYIKC